MKIKQMVLAGLLTLACASTLSARTISVVSSSGDDYTLAFDAGGAAELYVTYSDGYHDHGAVLGAWPHCVKLADVEADETQKAVTLPSGVSDDNRYARFFLNAKVTSASYESTGLIAQFDGFDNAISDGVRIHDPQATSWTDLCGGTAATLNVGVYEVCDDGIYVKAASASNVKPGVTTRSFAANDIYTIEVCATPKQGVNNACDAVLWVGSAATTGPVAPCRVGAWSAVEKMKLGYNSSGGLKGEFYEGDWNKRLGVTYTRSGTSYASYIDGTATGESYAFTSANSVLHFGNFAASVNAARGLDVVIHSIRIYSGALTDEQIKWNHGVDEARFGGGVAGCSAPIRFEATNEPTVEEVSLSGTDAQLSFPAEESPRAVYVVWGPEDNGPQTNGWLHVQKVGDVAAGETSVQVTVPSAALNDCYRYLLDMPTSVRDYDLAGAYAHWDGVLNSVKDGVPYHDAAATSWADLTGQQEACTVNAELTTAVEDGFAFDTRNSLSPALATPYVSSMTTLGGIEVTATVEDGRADTDPTLTYHCAIDDKGTTTTGCLPPIRIGAHTICRKLMFAEGSSFGNLVFPYATNYWKRLATIAYVREGDNFRAYFNGRDTGVVFPYATEGGKVLIGNFPADRDVLRGLKATVHSVRLYLDEPSASALQVNADVDVARFAQKFLSSTLRRPSQLGVRDVLVDELTKENGWPVHAELSFPASDRSSELFLAYGRVDGGLGLTNEWRHLVKLADIAAGQRTASCDLPGSAMRGKSFRFLLSAVPDASAYVQDGLLAHFDGLQNGIDEYGNIGHVGTMVNGWYDLTGGSAATITPLIGSMTNDGVLVCCEHAFEVRPGIVTRAFEAGAIGTVDVLATPLMGVTNGADSVLWCGPVAAARVSAWKENDSALHAGFYSNNGLQYKYLDGTWGERVGIAYTLSGGQHAAWVDGEATETTYSFTPVRDALRFGNQDGLAARGLKGVYHGVRVYNRELSAAEIKWNHAVDEARYGNGVVWGGSQSFDLPPLGLLMVVR